MSFGCSSLVNAEAARIQRLGIAFRRTHDGREKKAQPIATGTCARASVPRIGCCRSLVEQQGHKPDHNNGAKRDTVRGDAETPPQWREDWIKRIHHGQHLCRHRHEIGNRNMITSRSTLAATPAWTSVVRACAMKMASIAGIEAQHGETR